METVGIEPTLGSHRSDSFRCPPETVELQAQIGAAPRERPAPDTEGSASMQKAPYRRRFGGERTQGYVYFIQSGKDGPIKIGFSSNAATLMHRIESLQTANPYPLEYRAVVEGTMADEFGLHERFESPRLCGEWFDPSPELLGLIDRNARQTPAFLRKVLSISRPFVDLTKERDVRRPWKAHERSSSPFQRHRGGGPDRPGHVAVLSVRT
jgi:hypothetical protein